MNKTIFSTYCTLVFFLLFIGSAYAEENGSLTVRLGLGFMVIDSGNNLNPDGSDKIIQSLDDGADRETSVIPLLLPSLTWDIGEKDGAKIFFDTEPPIDEVGGLALNLGSSYLNAAGTQYQLSIYATPFEEVWKNPYLTGAPREDTETTKSGVKLAANRILGSHFRINFVYMVDEVDDDEIGEIEPDLERDGAVYSISTNYSFHPTENLELRPQISFRLGEYDGDSNSFQKVKASLKASYTMGRVVLKPEIFYSYSEYDEIHPLFQKTRENDSYGANVMVNYMGPFGYRDWLVMGMAGYSKGDSNIDFYDTESINFGLFLIHMF